MLGPKTVIRLTERLAPGTTHPPHTRRVMCHRGRYTELRHSMKDIDQRTRRARPTLIPQSTPTLMRKNFRRGRQPLCHTPALRIVYSTQPMVGRDTVTNTCYDKGAVPRAVLGSIGIVRFHQSAGPIAACAPISAMSALPRSGHRSTRALRPLCAAQADSCTAQILCRSITSSARLINRSLAFPGPDLTLTYRCSHYVLTARTSVKRHG
jgi:hypothetical protein